MASKIQGITVEIGGNTTKLGNALEAVNKKSKSLQAELKGVQTLLKLDPGNVTLLKQKQDLLNQSIAECREKLNTLRSTQIQVQEQFDKGEITQEQYRDFQREIVATEIKLKDLEKQARQFGSVGAQQIAAMGAKMKATGDSITGVGKKFTVVSAVASAGLTGITASAINFESAWTGVTKTVDGTEQELADIKQGLLDLSESTASSATDIAAVAEAAGQLGVKTENILSFTETMVRLGDSTNLSADEASTAIAQLYNIMGSDINTVSQFGSALVALGNNAATTEADIMNMASRIASSGSQVGLTEQEVLALAASLSSVGLEAEGGGSAISAVITQIDKDVALNSDTLATWASVAGMSITDFKNLWQNDAMSAIQSVVSGMGDASAGGENLNVILDELGVTSLRQTDTMKRLSGASELMSEMVDLSNQSWQENTALTEESEKRYQTAGSKIQQLKNTIQELCVKLGEILLPIVQKITNALSGFANWLTNLSPTAQKVILIVLGLVAAIGPLLITIGKLVSSIGSIMTYGPKVVSMFKMIKTAVSGLFSAFAANPIVLVIVAIIAAVVLLWNKCEWFRNLVMGLFEAIKGAVIAVWENIKTVWDSVYPYFVALWEGIKAVFSVVATVIGGFFQAAWNAIKLVWDIVVGYFTAIWEAIKAVFSVVATVISGFFQAAWNGITIIWDTVSSYFLLVWEGIKNIFSGVASFFKNIFSSAWNGIKSVFSGVSGFFQNIWNTIKNMFTNIGTTIGNAIGGAFKNVVNSIISFAENTINGFIRAINGAINMINKIPGVNISKLKELDIPKLKVGMANVPYDDYLALLHKGERVLTAKENKEYSNGENEQTVIDNSDNSFNLTINTPKETSPSENARLFRREVQRYRLLYSK